MLTTALRKLVDLASVAETGCSVTESLGDRQLRELLSARNGFAAFYSSLHVRRSGGSGDALDVLAWSRLPVWALVYPSAAGLLLFAEDVFGNQFGVAGDGSVSLLEVETGDVEAFAGSLEEWAGTVLLDHRNVTGWPLAEEWQRANRPLRVGERLVPRQPFVLGGDYELSNLRALPEREMVDRYSRLASAIASAPDGERVSVVGF